ncbi:MAG: folate family ECF transporter S component [Clostridiales bacterium]|nr:folate family ECF transporter S component [Clostridiales bacterium]
MSQSNVTPQFFKTPFSPAYWQLAAKEVKSIRMIALTALFVGLRVILSGVFIPVGDNLRIAFSFFINALGCYLCGPILGLISGFLTDILGYLLFPLGAFFPGYTLSAMAGSFLYGLFLYRQKLTVVRIFLCKLCLNLFVNVGLGATWSAMLYGKGYLFYLARSLTKNLLLLGPEVILMVLFFRIMLPILEGAKLCPRQPDGIIPLIGIQKGTRRPFTKVQLGLIGLSAAELIASIILLAFRYGALGETIVVLGITAPKLITLVFPILSVVIMEFQLTLSMFSKGEKDDRTPRLILMLILITVISLMGCLILL